MQSKGVIDDVGRHLAKKWNEKHPNSMQENPWSLPNIARIKREFDADPELTKDNYPELFYYYDGLLDTKTSQSVHPAGMVISPITLDDNFGVFDKDGENCFFLDMDNVHDYTGLAKYDFLVLKTVQVIRDTCNYIGVPYPKSHEVDWDDEDVWVDLSKNTSTIFQFESSFASDCLKRFAPKNLFEMALVTACLRPSGASYRDDLLARKVHRNPSEMIDELLHDNLGYCIFQEDTISFLQQICGLSGSAADTIRRGIGRKKKEVLDSAMPSILDGYCDRSPKPRDVAEQEVKEFLQIIEDSANYQFGKNHAIAYCMLSYFCAYYRYHYPIEFITAFLNNAANDEDIKNGTTYANRLGIMVTMPKWGLSRSEYFFDKERNIIAKGLTSIKYMSKKVAEELYRVAHERHYQRFVDVLYALDETSLDARQLDILIKLDFFSDFGNQRELLRIAGLFDETFKKGDAKQISKDKITGTPLEEIVEKYAVGVTKSGVSSKRYTLLDVRSILEEIEDVIMAMNLPDLDDLIKVQNFKDAMGYVGYVSGKEEDRKKLYLLDVKPLVRKKDGKQFGYSFFTKSIGSGKESRFTVFNHVYNRWPVEKGNIIYCKSWERDGQYFRMTDYDMIG